MRRLHIIDHLNLFFRAYHAAPPLTNSKGMPTGGVFVYTKSLLSLLATLNPTHLVIAMDARSFRKDLDPNYKLHRTPLDEEIRVQIKLAQAVLRAIPLPILRIDGFEADDIIATLVGRAQTEGFEPVVISGDKDLHVLANQGATIWDPKINAPLAKEAMFEKWGVPCALIPDLLALTGDTVDNIRGVPGAGPKTAAQWLTEHGSLDALIAAAADKKVVKGKRGDALRAAIADGTLDLARRLVALRYDVPIAGTLEDLAVPPRNEEVMRRLFTMLEFWSLMPSGMPEGPVGQPVVRTNYAPSFDAAGRRIA